MRNAPAKNPDAFLARHGAPEDYHPSARLNGHRKGADSEDNPLTAKAFVWLDPAIIPPREWLLGTVAIRGFVTVLVAPGGVGKTTYALAQALAIATGKPLLGDHVFQRCAAWVLNLEDPREEMQRRVTAAMIQHRIHSTELASQLFIHSGRDRRVILASMASLTSLHDGLETRIAYPDKAAIIAEVKRHGIGVIVVDPFINSHELDENSNVHMNAAARVWAEVAAEGNCAVILVHHTRKGAAGQAGEVENGRGGKALVDACRVGLTITAMTTEEANQCGVPVAERWRHVRVDDGKANMAPRADKARWFRLASIALGNVTPTYPNGDNVQAIEPWTAPSVFGDLSNADLNAALDLIDKGPGNGRLYGESQRGNSDRWAGKVLVERLDRTPEQAKSMLYVWLRSGLLVHETYRHSGKGRDETGLRVAPDKRPGTHIVY